MGDSDGESQRVSLGILARCDGGGLASITREVHRHLAPTRTLLLDLEEQGRGDCTPDDYLAGDVFRCAWKGGLADRAIDWVCAAGIDTLWTAEIAYDPRLWPEAHRRGIRTVCYAMPELAAWPSPPRTVHVPTVWRLDQLPNAIVLPLPVARDRLPFRERKRVEHLFHVAGAAMLDRNGTQILLDALRFVTADVRLTVRAERPIRVPACRVDVEVVDAPTVDYWAIYPDDADLLVMPRRYGGLSCVVQEAASLGIPALMLASDPYAQEPFVTTVPSVGSRDERMKGGRVPVHSADPRALAAAIDWLAAHPDAHVGASREAGVWAEQHAWDGPLGDRWRVLLNAGQEAP